MSDLFSSPNVQTIENIADNTDNIEFLNLKIKAKELGQQIDWVLTQRKSEYLKEILILQNHKSVAIRRKIASRLDLIAGKEIIENIKNWQKNESDRQTWLALETLADKLERGIETNKQTNIKILTVSEALIYIKKLLGESVYHIEGELSEVRPFQNMYYFALKDKQESRLNCWAFEKVVERIDFPFNEGLSVRLSGKFKLSKDAKLYFETSHIQLTGEGELRRNLKILEEKLTKEGLFDSSRKRSICKIPQNILLVASPSSAALSDFVKVLSRRRGGINIHFLPIKTQGLGAEALILTQLEKINNLANSLKIDTVVITRGGGSQDDLFVFNSEKIVRAIHSINRPTVVAIGHERDTTLAELVADLRCSTPSQAAEQVSFSRQEINQQAGVYLNFIKNYATEKKHQYAIYTNNILMLIRVQIQNQIAQNRYLCNKTNNLAGSILNQTRFETDRLWQYAYQFVQNQCRQVSLKNDGYYHSIRQLLQDEWGKTQQQFSLLSSQIFLHDPKNILAKGYALILQNEVVKESIGDIDQNQLLQIKMQDGTIQAKNLSNILY